MHNTSRWIQTVRGERLGDYAPQKRSEVVLSTEVPTHRDEAEKSAHKVDFSVLDKRNRAYLADEKAALEQYECRSEKAMAEAAK